MKPYGREKNLKGSKYKIDYHIHIHNKKIGNWWEDCDNFKSRKTLKQELLDEILDILREDCWDYWNEDYDIYGDFGY